MLAYILIPFTILLIVYLFFENKEKFIIATMLKVALSSYIAIIAWYLTTMNNNIYTILISTGLTLAIPADFFLQYIKTDSKKYKTGITFFSGMHLFLIISYYLKYGFNVMDLVVITIIIFSLFMLQTSEKWNLGKEKLMLSIYTIFVVVMSSKAISIAITIQGSHTILIGFGGLLFILSDFVLGIWDYYDHSKKLVLANRFIYFVGQILFALSIYYK